MNKYLVALAMPLLSLSAHAIDLTDDGSFKMTGFYSLTGAKVLSGSALGSSAPWTYQRWDCPCTIQGWEYTAVYEKQNGLSFDQESLLGVQFKKEFSPTLSATAQFVVRALNPNRGQAPTLDWGYLTFDEPRRERVRLTGRVGPSAKEES